MYIERKIEKAIRDACEGFPVILITGPRQVGKTTLLQHMAESSRRYVTLDDPEARRVAIEDPGLFLQRYKPPVIIDEIQYAPGLLSHIKMYVDTNKQMGDIWITGSQIFHLMQGVSESLAGRIAVINMQGLSNAELHDYEETPFEINEKKLISVCEKRKRQELTDIYATIFKGSMPALYDRKVSHELYYSSYVNTYIQRDIRQLINIENEMSFLKFLTSCAARSGQILNISNLSQEVGISSPTGKKWLSILMSSGLVYLVEPYFNNRIKRAIKSPKMYFMDTGLISYLTKWQNPESLEAGAMSGAIFETYAVNEIIKTYLNVGRRPPIFYYRDKDKNEIDLIIESDQVLNPIEIKKATNPGKNTVKVFDILDVGKHTVGNGAVVCMYHDVLPIDHKNLLVPVWCI